MHNLRLPTSGTLYSWAFERDGHKFSVRVEGSLTLSNIGPAIDAALDGVEALPYGRCPSISAALLHAVVHFHP